MKSTELREKTDDEIAQIVLERADDLLHFRMQSATGVNDNVRSAREARKDIARIRTIQNERRRAAALESAGDSQE